jgi:hypothetical protein
MAAMRYPIQDFAERLFQREERYLDAPLRHFLREELNGREFATVAEELISAALERGSLTNDDRREALALPGLKAVHWRLTIEPSAS